MATPSWAKAVAAMVALLVALWGLLDRIGAHMDGRVETALVAANYDARLASMETRFEIKIASVETEMGLRIRSCEEALIEMWKYPDQILFASRLRETSPHKVPEPEISRVSGQR